MRIYLAALWSQRDLMAKYTIQIEKMDKDHEVTSRWIWITHEDKAKAASMDLTDIDSCDTLVLFSAGPRGTLFSGGGRHVEFGYAMAKNKTLILIGPPENVFHKHVLVQHYPTWEAFRDTL